MTRKRRGKDHKERIHEEMLRHLDKNPLPPTPAPARSKDPPPKPASKKAPRDEKASIETELRRPRLMLRKMPLDLALETLERFLRAWAHQGVKEVVVVVGKGHGSPGGLAVLAPAVRDWLEQHSDQVAGYEDAPTRDGGSGAILVRLRP